MTRVDFLAVNKKVGVAASAEYHQQDILIHHKGWNKFSPHIGVGVRDYIDSEKTDRSLLAEVRRNFSADGIVVDKVNISKDKIQIDARN